VVVTAQASLKSLPWPPGLRFFPAYAATGTVSPPPLSAARASKKIPFTDYSICLWHCRTECRLQGADPPVLDLPVTPSGYEVPSFLARALSARVILSIRPTSRDAPFALITPPFARGRSGKFLALVRREIFRRRVGRPALLLISCVSA